MRVANPSAMEVSPRYMYLKRNGPQGEEGRAAGRAHRSAQHAAHAGHLRHRAPLRRGGDGAARPLALVVGTRRGTVDELLASGDGAPRDASAGGAAALA